MPQPNRNVNPNSVIGKKRVGRDLRARRMLGNLSLFASLTARPEVAPYPFFTYCGIWVDMLFLGVGSFRFPRYNTFSSNTVYSRSNGSNSCLTSIGFSRLQNGGSYPRAVVDGVRVCDGEGQPAPRPLALHTLVPPHPVRRRVSPADVADGDRVPLRPREDDLASNSAVNAIPFFFMFPSY